MAFMSFKFDRMLMQSTNLESDFVIFCNTEFSDNHAMFIPENKAKTFLDFYVIYFFFLITLY